MIGGTNGMRACAQAPPALVQPANYLNIHHALGTSSNPTLPGIGRWPIIHAEETPTKATLTLACLLKK
jgi:hypothetical protein